MAFMEAIIHEKLSFLSKKSIIQLLDLESSLGFEDSKTKNNRKEL